MVFKKGAALYAVEVERKGGEDVLYVNYLQAPFVPSLAEHPEVMARTIDTLAEHPEVSSLVFVQQRTYHYAHEQVQMLAEIARLLNYLVKQENILSPSQMERYGNVPEVHADLTTLMTLLRQDPLGCYEGTKQRLRQAREQLETGAVVNTGGLKAYVRLLERIRGLLEETKLIQVLSGQKYTGMERMKAYQLVLRPDVLPNFTFTRLVAGLPEDATLVSQYELTMDEEKIPVTIMKQKDQAKFVYHVLPPEYTLKQEHHELLHLARGVLVQHRPQADEFTDPERTRRVFFQIGRDLLAELARNKNIGLSYVDLQRLARILVRHTIGFGLLEVLLLDEKIQDVVLNAPIAQNPVFIRHQEFDECVTNIVPGYEDADSWAAKLRLQSGRPLDEAHPVLDTDLSFGKIRARVAAVTAPLSPSGLAYALRRHRDRPWTLPLFIEKKMLNSFSAGLLSFMIDGSRTILVAGTRSSGKTSLLGSLLLEIMQKYRILVVEDTLELPVEAMRELGYDILQMKVRSALVQGTTEVEASEGIRTSLRLGDSALIVGEVRSDEAKALYEAMRVGALANVVAGTIHGDSPYGVFDRVVNDLGVPATSFKATDLIAVANPIKTADGLHAQKRLVSLTEVRKHWTKDPLDEGGFVDLVSYNVEKDELEPSDALINGESEIIKNIAGKVKGWAGNWDAVYDNILLRGKVQQELLELSKRLKKPALLEAEFHTLANGAFHRISSEIQEEVGLPEGDRVFEGWKDWAVKKGKKF